MNYKKGISMIALIITIVIIIILATIAVSNVTKKVPKSTEKAEFMQTLSNVQEALWAKISEIELDKTGSDGPTEESTFLKVTLVNAPADFIDVDYVMDGIQGRVIDTSAVGLNDLKYGNSYSIGEEDSNLSFGDEDQDVFIYDGDKIVYYMAGFKSNGEVVYSSDPDVVPAEVDKPTITIIGPSIIAGKQGDRCTFSLTTSISTTIQNVINNTTLIRTGTANASMSITGGPTIFTISLMIGSGDGTIAVNVEEGLLQDGGKISDAAVSSPLSVINTGLDFDIEVVGDISVEDIPTNCSIFINGQSSGGTTKSRTVTLTLNATNASQVFIGENDNTEPIGSSNWITYSSTMTYTLSSGKATKTLYVWYRNGSAMSEVSSASIYYDPTPVVNSISITGTGGVSGQTTSLTNTISLLVTNAVEMYISTTNSTPSLTDSNWQAYSATKTHTFTGGDGTKTLYFWFKNDGSMTMVRQASIIYCIAPTNFSVSINSGAVATASTSVSVAISATNAKQAYVSTSATAPTVSTGGWITCNPSTTVAATIAATEGTKTVYVWFRNGAAISARQQDTITFNVTPTSGSVSINSGATTATASPLSIALSATNAKQVYMSTSSATPTTSTSGWVTCNPSTTLTHTVSTDGTYTLYAWFRNGVAISGRYSDSITYSGGIMPTGGYISVTSRHQTINSGVTNDNYVNVYVSATNSKQASINGGSWITCNGSASTTIWVDNGYNTVSVRFKNGSKETESYSTGITKYSNAGMVHSDNGYSVKIRNDDLASAAYTYQANPGEIITIVTGPYEYKGINWYQLNYMGSTNKFIRAEYFWEDF